MTRRERVVLAHQSARLLKEFLRRHCCLLFILLLVVAGTVGAADLLRHGGKSANPSWLYARARPRTVVVSQRPPAVGTTVILTPLERAGTPVLRTWQRGAIHFRWTPDGIITQGFLDRDACRSLPAWPTGEGACSRRVYAMLLSSPWVLHDTAGCIVISLAGFLLGVIACACWQSSSTAPGPWSCRPGRGLRRRTCSRRMRNRQRSDGSTPADLGPCR